MKGKYKVLWANSASEDLRLIVEYIHTDNPIAARDIFEKLKSKSLSLNAFPERGRIVPELKEHGILQYRELVIPPWRIIYRVSEKWVHVLLVIDSRRNVEDVLLSRLTR